MATTIDPVDAFLEAACVSREAHAVGTLEAAADILARHPQIAVSGIYAAAVLADEDAVRRFVAADPRQATIPGGPRGWDPLTHLCFSRYLRLDSGRAEAFVRTARVLLDAGASAATGWRESGGPGQSEIFESAIYGAAGVAQHPGLTRLLLERGADPNDGETPYHVPESYDLTVFGILLESGRLDADGLAWMLLRKTDWHDLDGVRLALEHGADPRRVVPIGDDAFRHALRRDNRIEIVTALLDHGADAAASSIKDGRSATVLAAHRGRGDVLRLLESRGALGPLAGADLLIAACARDDAAEIARRRATEARAVAEIVSRGGTLLAEFAGTGNAAGVTHLLDLGVSPEARYLHGDGYFDIAWNSTALHVAAWRGWPATVEVLIARGAPVNATDGRGRTALMLAVKACVDSHWTNRRSPDSVRALLAAGASPDGIAVPTGYDEADRLLVSTRG